MIALILLLFLLFGLSLQVSRFMAQRAVCTIIGVFRKHDAAGVDRARTLEQLGLAKQPFFRILRDYRPYAFQTLAQGSIIPSTQDGRFFLSEEMLALADGAGCHSI